MSPTFLHGHHALVTGASRGIGAAIADTLEAAGATVSRLALHTRPEQPDLIPCDVTNPGTVAQAFEQARCQHGPIHILVNNAGQAQSAPFEKTGTELLQQMLDVNLKGAWHCTQAAFSDLKDAAGQDRIARIINIASVAGLRGYPYVAAYCAAKHGLVGLTRALAAELAGTGITVNALCPGYTDTDLVRDAVHNIVRKTGRRETEVLASLTATNPQGRLIRPEEVASAVLWLCNPEAAAITGQSLSISGGEIMS